MFAVNQVKYLRQMVCFFAVCVLLCGLFPAAQADSLPELTVQVSNEYGDVVEPSLNGGYLLEPEHHYYFRLICAAVPDLMAKVLFTPVTLPEPSETPIPEETEETIPEEAAAEITETDTEETTAPAEAPQPVFGSPLVYDVAMKSGSSSCYLEFSDISVRQTMLVQFGLYISPPKVDPLSSGTETDSAGNLLPLWEQIPYYYQGDYPNTRYGSGTVAANGCSATALAMVASYMANHTYLPSDIAEFVGGRSTNNITRLEEGCELLQIPYTKAVNFNDTYAALQEGKVVIALMNETSFFTNSQHFLVLAGLNRDKVMVHDSNRNNQSVWQLMNGFKDGFDKGMIIAGYSGGWIFDKSEMPETPFIYSLPKLEHGVPRYPDVVMTSQQKELLARLVWNEARGEPTEGQQAVAEVLLNRFAADTSARNVAEIIYGEGQFRSVDFLDDARPTQAQYDAIERAIWGPYVLPKDVYYFATYETNSNVWGTIGNHIFCGAYP